jgi:BirA family biotin operon repressor/biotin-[acetyl-CoA-carboxylase] ligase
MNLPLSRALASRLEWLPSVESTNDALVERATGADAAGWPDLAVVVTDTQTKGRGRLGREWIAPAGKCLAVSVLLRPHTRAGQGLPADALGWLPLMAGAAMTSAIRSLVIIAADSSAVDASQVGLKWPNDVLIDGRKVCGILAELLPDSSVVMGSGVNLLLASEELPIATATSLTVEGILEDVPAAELLDQVAAAYLANLRRLYDSFVVHRGDAMASGLHAEISLLCLTLGRPVRAELPGGALILGTARGIDATGRLEIEPDAGGELVVVSAGDVTHLKVSAPL